MTYTYTILSIVGSLLLIGFFAGYEIAFITANRLSIELKKKQGKQSGVILSRFMEFPAKFISTCLIGLNISMVLYGLLFDQLINLGIWMPLNLKNEYLKLIFDIVLCSGIALFLGFFLPKLLFRAKNDVLLSFFAPLLNFFHYLFLPVTNFLFDISQWILKYVLNVRVSNKHEVFSKVDLENFFQQTKEQDEESQELNTELFENALSLPNIKIRHCLVPRTEIIAVEINTKLEDVRNKFIKTNLSRLLVYQESIDNIVGYIHQLDLFDKPQLIRDIIHPIIAVPESMSATDLINKFSKERKSIAWVVDEFGGTAGIITMEDVLEEIFGEILDEYDVEEFVEKQLAVDEFIFSGRVELDYLNEKYHINFAESDAETLSGYIINAHETIPKQKEIIIINNYKFDILTVSDTRIELIKMKILH